MTNLYVNAVLISDTQNSIKVNFTTVRDVILKRSESDGGVFVWSRAALVPEPITDFVASENLYNFITCNWTESLNAVAYHLADYDTGTIFVNDISPGFEWHDAHPGTAYNLCIIAESSEGGTISSNPDIGIKLSDGSVTIDYNSYTHSGTGNGTVSIGGGVGTFTPPDHVTTVNVCMCGGGGGDGTIFAGGGGGYRGEIASQTIDLVGGTTLDITIGRGGLTGSNSDGHPGGPSSLGSLITVNGGAGGEDGSDAHYQGNGAEFISPCGGTYRDGYRNDYFNGWGGQAGAFGNGGDALDTTIPTPILGAGAGSGSWGPTDSYGGDGRITISWN